MADVYFWRQVFVLTTGLFYSVSVGFMLSFPSVLNPAILSPNSTDIKASPSQASWIAASNGFSGILGFLVLSPILQLYGRKIVHIIVNIFLLVGWIIFSQANNITALYAARIIQGLAIGGVYINSMVISEYSDPKRRGYFVTLKKVAIAVGTLMCHAFSLLWNWRQVAGFAVMLPTTAILLTFFWPESPSYLAMKGRFKESETSYIWLHGSSNMKELTILQASQMQKQKKPSEKWYRCLFRKDFLKPLIIVSILTLLLDLCGKYYSVVYIIQIMVKIIGDKSLAVFCSLGADVLTIIALIFSCFVISYLKRRTLLFSFGIATVLIMLLIGLFTVLKLPIVWLTPSLILLQSFIVNLSVIPVCFTLIAEVFPLEFKGSGSCASGVVFTILYTLLLKLTPFLMEHTGVEGVYVIYGICIAVCLILLYFIVPETKDKTLQEIEDQFIGIKSVTSVDNVRLSLDSLLVKK